MIRKPQSFVVCGLLAVLAVPGFVLSQAASVPPVQVERSFEAQIAKPLEARYLLFLPEDYRPEEPRKWPLILFLHGAGERGDDLSLVRKHGPPKLVEERRDFPFIVVSPQCPRGEFWSNDVLLALLDSIVDSYQVDKDRIYLTGLSMGGYGTWSLAAADASRFAAIAPICGGGLRVWGFPLGEMPVWAFHGALDSVVPVEESIEMVNMLKRRGNKQVRLTIYPDADHDSWTETYSNEELYQWFLSHRRGE